jgi:hypothetical protein
MDGSSSGGGGKGDDKGESVREERRRAFMMDFPGPTGVKFRRETCWVSVIVTAANIASVRYIAYRLRHARGSGHVRLFPFPPTSPTSEQTPQSDQTWRLNDPGQRACEWWLYRAALRWY